MKNFVHWPLRMDVLYSRKKYLSFGRIFYRSCELNKLSLLTLNLFLKKEFCVGVTYSSGLKDSTQRYSFKKEL